MDFMTKVIFLMEPLNVKVKKKKKNNSFLVFTVFFFGVDKKKIMGLIMNLYQLSWINVQIFTKIVSIFNIFLSGFKKD